MTPPDPRAVPEDPAALTAFRQWVRTEAQRLMDEGEGPPFALRDRMVTFWKTECPKMVARVGPENLEGLATILSNRMYEAEDRYLDAGMYRTDAKEQAEREWLMMEPESPEE